MQWGEDFRTSVQRGREYIKKLARRFVGEDGVNTERSEGFDPCEWLGNGPRRDSRASEEGRRKLPHAHSRTCVPRPSRGKPGQECEHLLEAILFLVDPQEGKEGKTLSATVWEGKNFQFS